MMADWLRVLLTVVTFEDAGSRGREGDGNLSSGFAALEIYMDVIAVDIEDIDLCDINARHLDDLVIDIAVVEILQKRGITGCREREMFQFGVMPGRFAVNADKMHNGILACIHPGTGKRKWRSVT